jgi:hypothetical protein
MSNNSTACKPLLPGHTNLVKNRIQDILKSFPQNRQEFIILSIESNITDKRKYLEASVVSAPTEDFDSSLDSPKI